MLKVTFSLVNNINEIARIERIKGKYKTALTEVAKELEDAVKQQVPVKSKAYSSGRENGGGRVKQMAGNLKKSIGVFDSNSTKYVRVWVGARVKNGYDGWYAQMVHGGHKVYSNANSAGRNPLKRWRSKSIKEKTSGYVKGIPFITRTYNSKKKQLESKLTAKIGTDLETLIKQNNHA